MDKSNKSYKSYEHIEDQALTEDIYSLMSTVPVSFLGISFKSVASGISLSNTTFFVVLNRFSLWDSSLPLGYSSFSWAS